MPRDFICLMCPNGCHLSSRHRPDGAVEIKGHQCDKGLAFARSVLKGGDPGAGARLVPIHGRVSYAGDEIRQIFSHWGLFFRALRPQLTPEGSPERTVFRAVIEDDKGSLFILEQVDPAAFHTKMKIIRTLALLAERSLPAIVPYCLDKEGQPIVRHGDGLWQLVPFTHGVRLDRETYLFDAWRGDVLALFLKGLSDKARGMPAFSGDEVFSIKSYIQAFAAKVRQYQPRLLPEMRAVTGFLEQMFMTAHDALPVAFCHGDFHPLNIVWGQDDIRAVIDWEFLGVKPEIYDAANMVGCLGMEHPSSLTGPLVCGFIGRLREDGVFSDSSWKVFVEFVVALRFAWLSEWLRKKDEEMIALELEYMRLLIADRDGLRATWKLPGASL